MGVDKTTLEFFGSSLLEHTWRCLSDLALDGCWVSSSLPSARGYSTIEDAYEGMGPIGAIASCVRELRRITSAKSYLLVVPVDLPLLTAAPLRKLLDYSVRTAVGSYYEGSALPAVFPLSQCFLSAIESMVCPTFEKPRSVRELHHKMGTHALAVGDFYWNLMNVNTPTDLVDARKERLRHEYTAV
ncbi:MAG: NTP transferase domain-containing protein [Bdellovibrionales bacterium]|nr:NTP transferase domain-containing protein [Bdellovibrionales bacterium]